MPIFIINSRKSVVFWIFWTTFFQKEWSNIFLSKFLLEIQKRRSNFMKILTSKGDKNRAKFGHRVDRDLTDIGFVMSIHERVKDLFI